jgi:hypothetical protein
MIEGVESKKWKVEEMKGIVVGMSGKSERDEVGRWQPETNS